MIIGRYKKFISFILLYCFFLQGCTNLVVSLDCKDQINKNQSHSKNKFYNNEIPTNKIITRAQAEQRFLFLKNKIKNGNSKNGNCIQNSNVAQYNRLRDVLYSLNFGIHEVGSDGLFYKVNNLFEGDRLLGGMKALALENGLDKPEDDMKDLSQYDDQELIELDNIKLTNDEVKLINAIKFGDIIQVKDLLFYKQNIALSAIKWIFRYNNDSWNKNIGYYCKPLNKNLKYYDGNPILHLAIEQNIDIVRVLLDHNMIDPNVTNLKNQTALHYAIELNKYGTVRLLLRYSNADLNAQNSLKDTPLHSFVKAYDIKTYDPIVLDLILSKPKLDLSLQNLDGNTSLHLALQLKNHYIIHPIIKYIHDTSQQFVLKIKNIEGLTPNEKNINEKAKG